MKVTLVTIPKQFKFLSQILPFIEKDEPDLKTTVLDSKADYGELLQHWENNFLPRFIKDLVVFKRFHCNINFGYFGEKVLEHLEYQRDRHRLLLIINNISKDKIIMFIHWLLVQDFDVEVFVITNKFKNTINEYKLGAAEHINIPLK